MTIFVRDNVGDGFVRLLPSVAIAKMRGKSNGRKCRKMDAYLRKTLGIGLDDVIDELAYGGIKVGKVKNVYAIRIDTNAVEPKSGIKLVDLVKLIDYGNDEVSGIGLVDGTFKFIQDNLKAIYANFVGMRRKS